jgi:cardiolipin synthase
MSKSCVVLLAVVTLVAACRQDNGAGDDVDGGVVTPDGPDGTGCTALTPRTQAPEPFIGPTGLEARLGVLIDSATTSLDIQMYLWTVTGLANKVVAAKNRGVKVRIILDPDEAGNNNVEPIFNSAQITWKNASTLYTFSHAKYMLIDHARVVIMSMNFNADAMSKERNFGIVDRDPEDIADVEAIFAQDWAMANGMTPMPANLTCTRLVVSPTNSKTRLIEHINSAQSTLDVELMYISEDSVRTAIGNAKSRGVTVRAILSEATDESIPYLKGLGIPVRIADTFYLHSKLIIADDVAFVGSENMSFTSLTKNREVGALVFEPSAFAPIQAQFDTDWTTETTPAP